MQNLLFRNQKALDKALDGQHYREYGESLGLDVARFEGVSPWREAEVPRQLSNDA